jgi:hypothetical protein
MGRIRHPAGSGDLPGRRRPAIDASRHAMSRASSPAGSASGRAVEERLDGAVIEGVAGLS